MTRQRFVGLGLLVLVVAVTLAVTVLGVGRGAFPPSRVTVNGTIGSEKANFLDDEKVKALLLDRYGVTVNYRKAGSIVLVQEDVANSDFLWPSSQFARELFEQSRGTTVKSEIIFNSPIVMYAWKPIAEALRQQGVVTREGNADVIDLPRFVQLIDDERTWKDLGVPSLSRKVLVYTTDPTKSNSGLLFAGLLATTMNHGDLPTDSSIGTFLPHLQAFYARLGFMQDSSGYLFDQFLASGMGAYPIIVGYENQLIEYSIANPSSRDVLNNQITILYPRPSVWAAHTLISLNPNGDRLLTALKDPDIQKLAWENHGFRSGLLGVQNDPSASTVAGISSAVVEASPMPSAVVMNRIIEALRAGSAPPVTPSPSR
jgi:hypothetical protein